MSEEGSWWEKAVIVFVIAALGLMALVYDSLGLYTCWRDGGLVDAGRAISAMALGWMCAWYFTMKFKPTNGFLVEWFFTLAGHVVAIVACGVAMSLMLLVDVIGTDPQKATFLGLTSVTFAPIAAWFSTQIAHDRSVHVLSGFGIGALTYIVVFGLPR